MVVGTCQLNLSIPGAHSLKDKRQVLKSLMARARGSFNASVAEVGQNDLWQSAVIGIAVVGNDRGFVNSTLDNIIDFIEGLRTVEIVSQEIEIMNY
ncbi:MAG TPA: DUF503 domain-containing protein [Thermodesulfobacteriota bacterium]|nr:DUF503 domain-containing protein [Thermodesulfobacteriota bacterium]